MANQQSKNIQYSGLTTLPDDYQSVDGSLAFATNAVYEDNAVKIIPPALAKNLIVEKGDKVYVHSMATYTHYIVVHQSEEGVTLYWVDEADCGESDKKVICVRNEDGEVEDMRVHTIGTYAGTFVDLAFVGNTMILSTSESLQYILWKAEDDTYIYLGNGTPKIDIQFGLALDVVAKEYEKAGLTYTDKQKRSSDDFTIIGSVVVTQQSNVTSNFNKNYFDEGLTLEPGIQYQLRYPYPLTVRTQVNTTYLYGYKVDDSGDVSDTATQIHWTTKKSEASKFSVSEKYRKLYVEVAPTVNTMDYTISSTLYIESSGATSSIEFRQVEDTSENYVAVMGYMNKFVNEYATKKDKFIYPFFVRYAVKAYDGSNLYESVPILMYPNTGYAPYFDYRASGSTSNSGVLLMAFIADLQYRLLSTIGDEWADVVTGVDVFVSPPIYPYDQGRGYDEDEANFEYKLYDTIEKVDEITKLDYGIGLLGGSSFGSEKYQPYSMSEVGLADFGLLSGYTTSDGRYSGGALLLIAPFEEEEIKDKIKTTSTFYKIKTIKFDELKELSGEFASIDMEKDTLNALEVREAFKEEDVQYDDFAGNSLFVYNNRLHLIGGGQGEAVLPAPVRTGLQNGYYETSSVVYDAFVLIRTDQGTKKATVTDTISAAGFPWFFYPNTNAHELWVRYRNSSNVTDWYVLQLETHDFLNGSYYFPGPEFLCENYGSTVTPDGVLIPTNSAPSYGNTLLINNKIYVSEASNPFVFKNSMVCTAGSGRVLSLSSAAKALSQGQFGQFPLYAFTDEGIWAMSVGSTGAYETVQPIARDVVPTDAVKAITQLDSAVVFVTDRGVMLIEGSNVVCMSDDIDGDFGQFDPRTLDGFYDIMKKHLGFSTDDTDNTIGKWASQAFFDFIRSCQMKYDYVHQRITMYSDDCDIAYVYSLKSKQWLMQLTALQDNVNSYPDAYALRNTDAVGGVACTELVNLSEYDLEAERRPMVFVTRPFKLDAPDTFKAVNDIMQRGYFRQDENVKHIIGVSLYGSPDLFNWFLIKNNVGHKIQNLHGSPYKYFRVLVVSQLDAKEGISGCSVWYEPKDTQRMR